MTVTTIQCQLRGLTRPRTPDDLVQHPESAPGGPGSAPGDAWHHDDLLGRPVERVDSLGRLLGLDLEGCRPTCALLLEDPIGLAYGRPRFGIARLKLQLVPLG